MNPLRCSLLLAAIGLAAGPAAAGHHHRRGFVAAPETTVPYRYDWGNWQAEANARATERQRAAPGLTEELAPDAKETATGGPVGGVPGFDSF